MASTELEQTSSNLHETLSHDSEAQILSNSSRNGGGWTTFPFIIGTVIGLTLSVSGCLGNLIVYLIEEFNMNSIDAAQISNVVSGCTCLLAIVGAVIADSFLGCFSVYFVSSCITLLGMILFTLTATIDSLRPPPCEKGSNLCKGPTRSQFAVLYATMALATVGLGGTRFTIATLGADQFDRPKNRDVFFNWWFFTMYTCSVIGLTVIVYVEDNVSWRWGFGICSIACFVGLIIFLSGTGFYRHHKSQGSPFVDIARVVVASINKRKIELSSRSEDYFYDDDGKAKMVAATPTNNFKLLNRAALKTEEDFGEDGSIAKPWRLCTVQQVEDLKALIKILPVWSSNIFISTPIAIQSSLTVLQALTLDRHIGSHFTIPAGSFQVITLLSTSIFLTLIDRFLYPMWQKLTGQSPTPLQRISIGHAFNILGMAVSALVESKRLKIAQNHHVQDHPGSLVPMLALWLFPQLILVGIGEAFHFPGQVALCYQEFPESLKTTATAMVAIIMGIGFYLSTALVDLTRRVTRWLPDNINNGKLDNVYWMVTVVGVLNFGYFLVCAKFYKYQHV
ncbi:hypothetical protein UlMin_013611 [Ulmus minor]